MFGPLPRLHRILIALTVLLIGIASGAWIAYMTAVPLAVTAGGVLGAAAGAGLDVWLLRERPSEARLR